MWLNAFKGIAFVLVSVALMLALSMVLARLPVLGDLEVLGIDLAFALALLITIPVVQAIFRRISWLRFRGL